MCFSVKTYQNTTHTPVDFQTSDDLEMGKTLNAKICDSLEQDFPALDEGGLCDDQSEWRTLESKIGEVCDLTQSSAKLGQDVKLTCSTKKDLVENVDGCGSEVTDAGTRTLGGGSLTQTFGSFSTPTP